MFIISGYKRSGTSLMCQMFDKAGFNGLGERFPKVWEETIKVKNTEGFYESKFIEDGANNQTSPWPASRHTLSACKIFCGGIIKTDQSYIDKIVLMVRDWRTQTHSLRSMYANTNEHGYGIEDDRIMKYPDGYEFFHYYYEFIKDYRKRGYDTLVVDYDTLLTNPKEECDKIKGFIGVGRWDLAAEQVDPSISSYDSKGKECLVGNKDFADFLDRFYQGIKSTQLSEELLKECEGRHKDIVKIIEDINNNRN